MNNTTVENLKVSDLRIGKYQRRPEFTRVKEYIADYNPELIGTLKVSLRDGKYYIVDGQHRFLVLKEKNIDYVMCEIHIDLTYEQEAQLFYKLNCNRRSVQAVDKELARCEGGAEDAVLIQKVVNSCGFVYSRGKIKFGIAAVNAIKNIYANDGVRVLKLTLELLKETWGGDPRSTDTEILRGVALFVKNTSDFDPNKFVRKMRRIEPTVIIREGKSDISNSGFERFECVIRKYYKKNERKAV